MEIKLGKMMTEEWMCEYGLADWEFSWSRGKRTLGMCDFRKQKIFLSREFVELNDENEVRNVILHEIAHALVGHGCAHGKIWKSKAKEIGCDAKVRCNEKVILPEAKYYFFCKNCEKRYPRNRKPRVKSVACVGCCKKYAGGDFSSEFLLEFMESG